MRAAKSILQFGRAAIEHGVIILSLVILIIFAGNVKGNETDTDLIERIEDLIFSTHPSDPDFLSDYRTGHWSWDITALIYSIETTFDTKRAFVEAIEASIDLSGEHHRLTEDKIASDPEKARRARIINRVLIRSGSSRFRYFTHNFWFLGGPFPWFTMYELRVIVSEKQGGRSYEEIEVYLFNSHF